VAWRLEALRCRQATSPRPNPEGASLESYEVNMSKGNGPSKGYFLLAQQNKKHFFGQRRSFDVSKQVEHRIWENQYLHLAE